MLYTYIIIYVIKYVVYTLILHVRKLPSTYIIRIGTIVFSDAAARIAAYYYDLRRRILYDFIPRIVKIVELFFSCLYFVQRVYRSTVIILVGISCVMLQSL